MNLSQRNVLRVVVPPLLALGLVALVSQPIDSSFIPGPANATSVPANP